MLSSRSSTRSAFPLPCTASHALSLLLPQAAILSVVTGCYPRSNLGQLQSKGMRNGSLTTNTTWFLEENFRLRFTSLTLFPLFSCSLHVNRRGNIVIYFSSHRERDKKWESSQKNVGSRSTTQQLRSGQKRWRSKSPKFFWQFGKVRFSCLKRSAVWQCLGHLAHPQLLLLHRRDAPSEHDAVRAWLWCCESEL